MPITIETQWFMDIFDSALSQVNREFMTYNSYILIFQNKRLLMFGLSLSIFILSLVAIVWAVKPHTSGNYFTYLTFFILF